MSQVLDSLEAARDAATRLAWRQAHATFSGVGDADLGPEDLELFGEAAWWTGKLDQAIRLRERAYAAYTTAGTPALNGTQVGMVTRTLPVLVMLKRIWWLPLRLYSVTNPISGMSTSLLAII